MFCQPAATGTHNVLPACALDTLDAQEVLRQPEPAPPACQRKGHVFCISSELGQSLVNQTLCKGGW